MRILKLTLIFPLFLFAGCQSATSNETSFQQNIKSSQLLGFGVSEPGHKQFTHKSEIPISVGTKFGMTYHIDVLKNTELEQVIIFPDDGITHPEKGRIKYEKHPFTAKPSKQRYSLGYIIEHDWENIPGSWTLQIKSGDMVILEKVFYLTNAQDNAR